MELERNKKKCVIYGAGEFGKRLYEFFSQHDIKISYFCQTDKDERTELYNIPLISLDELINIKELKSVFIAINDIEISSRIKFKLANLLTEYDEILECGDFIKTHLPESGSNRQCILCRSKVRDFLPGGRILDIYDKRNIIGDGFREKCYCPICSSTDRERWCFEVIKRHTKILETQCTVLHIAPEDGIRNRILHNELCDYYSGGINKKSAGNIVDVTNIQYRDNFFDYIIMNDVLDKIIDIKRTIRELKRVLKKDGKIIMSFPICMDFATDENRLCSIEKKLQNLGHIKRVRLFGYDYLSQLDQMGICAEAHIPKKEYTDDAIDKFGFTYNDIVLICTQKSI